MHADPPVVRSPASVNLFFALSPDAATRKAIAAAAETLRTEFDPPGRWLKPARYHLTLQFLGSFTQAPADLVARAVAAASQVSLPAFDVVLDVVGSFGASGMPVWIGCRETPPALLRLHDELGIALARLGCRPHGPSRLVPHVTVLRDAKRALRRPLAAAIPWRVDEFVLIESRTPDPYRTVGRWSLA
ncbi:RNA 2',3'-cyclic phosphodiesterase [Dokdonella sp.]|uniref:RNA 2',3'-cyclic phosphodiesterase n=1 Tax=Dokdonella sp. TaxID=2291710 RepID=UPI002F41EC51